MASFIGFSSFEKTLEIVFTVTPISHSNYNWQSLLTMTQ